MVPEDPGITLEFMEHSDIFFRQGTGICHTLIAIGDKFRLQFFFCPHAPYESARDKAASMCRLLLQGETCAWVLFEFLVGHVGPKFVTVVCMARFAQTSSGLFRIQYLLCIHIYSCR